MKLNPFCMCCAINKQEKKIRDFDDADRKTEYMKKSHGAYGKCRRGRLCPEYFH